MKNKGALSWILFALLSLTWGSSFILMKVGLEGLTPYQVGSLRLLTAGLVMLPLLRKALKEVPKNVIGPIVLSGFLGSFFPAFLFTMAGTKIDSSLSGILNALTPIFTIAIGVAFFKLKIGWIKWLGMFLGFAGMLILLFGNMQRINLDYMGYTLLVLMATLFYGLNVNMVNQYLREVAPMHIASIAFSALILPTGIILAATGYFSSPMVFESVWIKSTLASLVLGILGTGAASVMFYMLVKRSGPVFASMVTYAIPLVAIGWGLTAGETVTAIQWLGMSVILIGVRIANR